MFDFAWSSVALIGVVALIAIGPKDLPVAIKGVANMVKKARKMAGEFQTHVDEMVREANLDGVKDQLNELRNFDLKGEIEKAVDADGTLRDTFSGNPLDSAFGTGGGSSGGGSAAAVAAPPPKWEPFKPGPPAFIPPEIAEAPEPPAFIPPDVVRH